MPDFDLVGTSVRIIEAHGALLDTAHESLLERLEVGTEIRSWNCAQEDERRAALGMVIPQA